MASALEEYRRETAAFLEKRKNEEKPLIENAAKEQDEIARIAEARARKAEARAAELRASIKATEASSSDVSISAPETEVFPSHRRKCRYEFSEYLKNGQVVRHQFGDDTWNGKYNESNNSIECDGKLYKSFTNFSDAHLKSCGHKYPRANGPRYCEVEDINGKWISVRKVR